MEKEELKILKEILKWTKVSNFDKIRKILVNELNSKEKILAYSHSNGVNTSRDVSKASGVRFETVTSYWKNWYSLGIAEPVSSQRGARGKKIFNLEDFGIEMPKRGVRK